MLERGESRILVGGETVAHAEYRPTATLTSCGDGKLFRNKNIGKRVSAATPTIDNKCQPVINEANL